MKKLTVPIILVIASACALLVLSFGLRSSFGLFVNDITQPNGWGREVISLSLAIQNLSWGIVAVFAGGIADRFGSTKVIVGAAILYGLGIWFTAGVDSVWVLHGATGLLVGAGIAGTAFGIILPAMARAVGPERRQWALGLGTAAGSFGQFLIVPIVQGLVDFSDWQTALHLMAVATLFMALLAIPLAPYSGSAGTVENAVPDQTLTQALQEALYHGSYWWLLAGFFVCGFNIAFITVHMPSFLQDLGFSAQIGAWSIAIIGLFNVVGSYSSGIISGKWSMRQLLAWIYFARAILVAVFILLPPSLINVLIFSAMMGLLWLATVPPTSGLIALMFGTRYMSLLYGIVFLSHQLGSFSGVWLGGWLYDRYGSYDVVWWLSVGLALFAALAHLPIKEKPVDRLAYA
ncbi:MAG: MFS transporter [Cellvibrionaceae bacterium]